MKKITLVALVISLTTSLVGYAAGEFGNVPGTEVPFVSQAFKNDYNTLIEFVKSPGFKFAQSNSKTPILNAIEDIEKTGAWNLKDKSRYLNFSPTSWVRKAKSTLESNQLSLDGVIVKGTDMADSKKILAEKIVAKADFNNLSQNQKVELKKELLATFNDDTKNYKDVDAEIKKDKEFAKKVDEIIASNKDGAEAAGKVSLNDVAGLEKVAVVAKNPVTTMLELKENKADKKSVKLLTDTLVAVADELDATDKKLEKRVDTLAKDIMAETKIRETADNMLAGKLEKLSEHTFRGLAEQAALSGLFQPTTADTGNITAAIGGHMNYIALAIGGGYKFKDNVAVKFAVSTSFKSVSYNAGVNFEFK